MKLLYFWCDKYLNLKNYNCNLAGNIEFSFDYKNNKLIGYKIGDSEDFFNILDKSRDLIPIEFSVIAGKNGIGKTTSLKMISEVLANKGFFADGEYKINYIFIYEINNKKYICFEEGIIDKIIIIDNNEELEIFPANSLQYKYDYNIKNLKVCDNLKANQILYLEELDNVATLFLSNAYFETCEFSYLKHNYINLSNHYLLNSYFRKDDSTLFKTTNFDGSLNPFDCWKMELIEWDVEFFCSSTFEQVIKNIRLVSPRYFNILLDYTEEELGIDNLNVRRFNNKSIKKFSFEEYIERIMKDTENKNFFGLLNERICDILAEYILSQAFISEEKIITLVNDLIDLGECSTITEVMENIVVNFKEQKEEIISKIFLSNIEMQAQKNHTYERIVVLFDVTIEFLKKIELLKDKCNLQETFITRFAKVQRNENEVSIIEVKIPVLIKELDREKSNREIFDFIRELSYAQRRFYEITKFLPIRFNTAGISAGEKAYLEIFSKLFKFSEMIKEQKNVNNIVILMDEVDIYLHPEWKRQFVYLLAKFLKITFPRDMYKGIHIILTTNSPYLLSDVPRGNTVLLDKKSNSNEIIVKDRSEFRTLGANILDLLDDAFFLSKSNKGEYITRVIRKISQEFNSKEFDREKVKKYIEFAKLIDEPLMQRSLIQKLSGVLEETQKEELINYYQRLIDNLKYEVDANAKDSMPGKQ